MEDQIGLRRAPGNPDPFPGPVFPRRGFSSIGRVCLEKSPAAVNGVTSTEGS